MKKFLSVVYFIVKEIIILTCLLSLTLCSLLGSLYLVKSLSWMGLFGI